MIRRALLCTALLLVAAPAWAEDVAGARAAFESGAQLASEGRWSDALAQFEVSASKRPHATTSYNIGFCERALGHPTRAKKFFDQALARDGSTSGAELTPELRAATKKYLEQAAAQIASPELTLEPADVAISVDGRPLEAAETAPGGERMLAGVRPAGPGERVPRAVFVLEVDAGAHEIVILGADGRTRVAHEYFAPQSTKKLRLALPPPAPRLEVDHGNSRRTWGYVLGGVGLAAIGAGAYFGFAAASSWSDAKDACPLRDSCPDTRGATLSSDARTWANLSTIALTAGTFAVAGGVVLVLTAPTPRTTVSLGPASVSFTTRF